jgi:hypothetical protein
LGSLAYSPLSFPPGSRRRKACSRKAIFPVFIAPIAINGSIHAHAHAYFRAASRTRITPSRRCDVSIKHRLGGHRFTHAVSALMVSPGSEACKINTPLIRIFRAGTGRGGCIIGVCNSTGRGDTNLTMQNSPTKNNNTKSNIAALRIRPYEPQSGTRINIHKNRIKANVEHDKRTSFRTHSIIVLAIIAIKSRIRRGDLLSCTSFSRGYGGSCPLHATSSSSTSLSAMRT